MTLSDFLLAGEHPQQREERFAELTRGWAIGSATFALEMQEPLMARQPSEPVYSLLGADRAGQLQVRRAAWAGGMETPRFKAAVTPFEE